MIGIPLAQLRDILRNSRHTGIVLSAVFQRFGYGGIRSLLIISLISEFKMSELHAGRTYGVFYGSLCLTSIIGGFSGDSLLGTNRAGSLGLGLMLAGQLTLATGHSNGIIVGLSIYSLGFGLFNPNMNAVVAKIYQTEESLRSAAFTILYTGINLGMMLGPVVSGYIAAKISWRYGILAGAPFTLLALILFAKSANQPAPNPLDARNEGSTSQGTDHTRDRKVTIKGKKAFGLVVGLGLLAVIFSGVFDQVGSSVTLLVNKHVRREFLNFTVPAGYVQAINPFLVMLFGPAFSVVIKRRALLSTRISKLKGLMLGFCFLGMGFSLLSFGTIGLDPNTQESVGWIWIFSAIFLATFGELLFMPTAQALVGGMSTERRKGIVMGAWAASLGVGMLLSGMIAGIMSSSGKFSAYFAMSSGCCLLASLFLLFKTRRPNTVP